MFTLSQPESRPEFKFQFDAPKKSLLEKYRPKRLADIVGQRLQVDRLKAFVANPHSEVFVFEGESGTGKTTAAECLANELGADDWSIVTIESGHNKLETVESALRTLRHSAMGGSGWKVVIVNEADSMSEAARKLWFGTIEEIKRSYDKSIIIFTTNHAETLEARFVQRCKFLSFWSDAETLLDDAQELADRIWSGEGMTGDSPCVRLMPGLADKNGNISFRDVVNRVETAIGDAIREDDAPPPPPPSMRTEKRGGCREGAGAPKKSTSYDWVNAARRYAAGVKVEVIAQESGVSKPTARRRLADAGISFKKGRPLGAVSVPIDPPVILKLYA